MSEKIEELDINRLGAVLVFTEDGVPFSAKDLQDRGRRLTQFEATYSATEFAAEMQDRVSKLRQLADDYELWAKAALDPRSELRSVGKSGGYQI